MYYHIKITYAILSLEQAWLKKKGFASITFSPVHLNIDINFKMASSQFMCHYTDI